MLHATTSAQMLLLVSKEDVQQLTCVLMHVCQARFPLIARVNSAENDSTNGSASQPGGPNRFLLPANYSGPGHALLVRLGHWTFVSPK